MTDPDHHSSTSDHARGSPPERPIAWVWLLVPAALHLALHVLTNGNYGIFRDEYYYLACAARPDWGYVDHPALSIWLLAGWKAIFGQSVHSIRILPGLCGSALIVLTGVAAARLGGGRWAQLLAGVASGVGAAGLVICGFYSMNCYDFLFWIGAYILLIQVVRTGDGRWWPWLGLVLGIGLFNKIGLLVLGAALALGILATEHRRHLLDRRLYLAGILALLFLTPYVLWNAARGWPTLEFIDNARQYKIAAMAPLDFLSENILQANPLTVPVWIGGLAWLLFARSARRFRIVGLVVVATWVLLVAQKSKPYYFAASFPVMMAAGGVAWERWTTAARWRWARWLVSVTLVVGFGIFAPLGLPLISPERLARYQTRLGITPTAAEHGHDAELPQYFADRFGWEELARAVSEVYSQLPAEDRDRAVIIGANYGHAGALEYWSREYELPPVYSVHNNYWFWGPPPADEDAVIIVTTSSFERTAQRFEAAVEVAAVEVRWAEESRISIVVGRGLMQPVDELWDEVRNFI